MTGMETLARDISISIGVILLMWGAGYLLFVLSRKISSRYIEPESFNRIRTPFISLIILFGAYLALHRLGVRDHILSIADSLFFIVGTLFSVKIIYDLINMTIQWYSEDAAARAHIPLDTKFLPLVDVTVKIVVILIGVSIILAHFNTSFGSMIAAMGIGSLAIGLAAKDTLANTISGFIIMIDRPFKLNDRIRLASGKSGIVISIGLRSVRLRDEDNSIIIIPNTELVNMQLVNLSQPDSRVRQQLRFSLAYGTNLEQVRSILKQSAGSVEWIMKEPPPDVLFSGFGRFGLRVVLFFFVDVENLDRAVNAVMTEILKRFREENIEVARYQPYQTTG
jgi:small-conductance mechanosensitive channel